jgi:ATP-dependent RNA helicase SUPV3L1/SUV3
VRRAEAARFREGEAEILVATDAIGMGLNLPIRRVVFSTSASSTASPAATCRRRR